MKKILYQLIILLIFCLLLISGCKNRQVKQLIELPSTTDSISSDIDSDSINTDNQEEPFVDTSTQSGSGTNDTSDSDSDSDSASASTSDSTELTMEASQTATSVSTSSDQSTETPSSTPLTTSPVIIAESVNIDDVDERAMILNELDSLLNSVLTSLDDLDENPITEDINDW